MNSHKINNEVDRFLTKYIDKTISNGVYDQVARWYVIHSENYIKANVRRLSEHRCSDLDKYLNDKYRNFSRMGRDGNFFSG